MGSCPMRLALVYPPFADATQPYASLPALAAFLRIRGKHQVSVHDANLDFCLALWTKKRINLAALRLEKRLSKMEKSSSLSPSTAEEYAALTSACLKAPHVAARIEGAVRDLRSLETFTSLERLAAAKRVLQDADDLFGAESALLRRRIASFSPADIARLTRAPGANPFGEFFEKVTIPQLLAVAPGAVGISITYPTQIVPAVALARALRRHDPPLIIIFGGQIVSVWYDDLALYPEIFDWCDYVVGYEGETALDALLSAIETGANTTGIANVAKRENSSVRKGPIFSEDINELPTPDYSDLPLHRYVAPEPVLLLNTTRGCYWSRCTFCSVSPSMRRKFRMRNPDLVVRDFLYLRDRHLAHCFSLGDDCVPPVMLRALAQKLVGAGVAWQCEVRFESALTASLLRNLAGAGCKNLIFGLESYTERVLECMKKGIRLAEIDRILQDCRDAGLAFNLQLFFGFPGESDAEARETMEFATGQLHGAATLSFGQFHLQRGSAIAHDPAGFGIKIQPTSRTLAIDLPYRPFPLHATSAQKQLAEQVLKKAGGRALPLGIDAHTLLYLHRAGVRDMAKSLYRVSVTSSVARKRSEAARWRRRTSQTLRSFRDWEDDDSRYIVLYDYEMDRTVEISRLSAWVLGELIEYASTDEIVTRAAGRAQLGAEEVKSAVRSALLALDKAGLLDREGLQPINP
jgi:anaerobic magnesium-protoporphyrin IX monomethyl ester cyclase